LNNDKTNLIAIDVARAIAALGVFFYHQHVGALLVRCTKIEIFIYIDAFGALYAVPLFFLISGYCIHLSNLKYVQLNKDLPLVDYYKRRFLRIYPPYLAAFIITVILNKISHFRSIPSLHNSLVHLFCLEGFIAQYFFSINLVLWTITVEMAFYIIYPVFYYIRLKRSLNLALVFAFVTSCISIYYISIQKNISFPQYYWVGNIWFSWCCGAFIADKLFFDQQAFNKTLFKVIYIFIVSLFLSFRFFNINPIIGYQLKILIWTAPLIYLLSKEHWLRQQKSLILTVLVYIGLSSYSLYLLHEPLIIFKNYVVHTFLLAKFQIIGLIIGVIIIPIIAWLNYCFIEKPFINRKAIAKR
jgi:peptidoglycan/LPS O-acetylase OafA/YrhL